MEDVGYLDQVRAFCAMLKIGTLTSATYSPAALQVAKQAWAEGTSFR